MKIDKVTMSKERAIKALREYREVLNTKRKDYIQEIELTKKCYYQLSRGRAIINILEAFKTAGYNEKNEPRLAFAQAKAKTVFFNQSTYGAREGYGTMQNNSSTYGYTEFLRLPEGTFQSIKLDRNRMLNSKVPLIPPKHLPKSLTNCYLLWEVTDWKVVTKDPILLKKINNSLYAVIATWNLTKLERLIIAGR
jgi:hypothetical protein